MEGYRGKGAIAYDEEIVMPHLNTLIKYWKKERNNYILQAQ